MTYDKAGRVLSTTDPAGYVTQQRYDAVGRLMRVVQAYASNGIDPALWVWDDGDDQWENGSNEPIEFGTGLDRNIIAEVVLDKGGRRESLRDPRGNRSTYNYDLLNRRTSYSNPHTNEWQTAYSDLGGGGSRILTTDPLGQEVQQDFDRLGRLLAIQYLDESPKLTPDVTFTYNAAGNRILMSESDGMDPVRATTYGYDAVRRLIEVDFDTDGDGNADQTLTYAYDAGGLRTRLELPDGKAVTYTYNARGELTDLALADWETQSTTFSYDNMGRLQSAAQLNGPQTSYHYDEAGHLLDLLHEDGSSNTLAHFEYEVDARGNRTAATETLAQPSSGDLVLEITYDYDALARLIGADYTIGTDTREHDFTYDPAGNRTQEVVTLNSTPTTTNYTYDIANRLSQIGGQSVDYDNAGRLTDDGTLTYTWDRANRLLNAGGSSYRYNGVGQRVDQTVSSVVTEYLLDGQPGLWQVLAATTGSDVTRFVHGPRGLHLQQQPNTDWVFPLHDGLNSLRSFVDEALDPLNIQNFAPYGSPFGAQGSSQSSFGFTGEPTDQNDLVQLRARYLNPNLGSFSSLDAIEGFPEFPMSLNNYSYAEGNPINWIDPSGNCLSFDLQRPSTIGEYLECLPMVSYLKRMGINLTVEDTDIRTWDAQRVRNVYNAVHAIENVLGGQTRGSIGDTELLLVNGSNPVNSNAAAVTSLCNRIRLYLQTGGTTNWLHTSPNLVHEFGHIITLGQPTGRILNSEARIIEPPYGEMALRPVALWDEIRLLAAFEYTLGWDTSLRQSNQLSNAEYVPDMFMFYVFAQNGVSSYQFHNDVPGRIREAFLRGGPIPCGFAQGTCRNGFLYRTALNLEQGEVSRVESAGLSAWVRQAGYSCPSQSQPQSDLYNFLVRYQSSGCSPVPGLLI